MREELHWVLKCIGAAGSHSEHRQTEDPTQTDYNTPIE